MKSIASAPTNILYHLAKDTFPTTEQLAAILAELKNRLPKAEFNALVRIIPVSR